MDTVTYKVDPLHPDEDIIARCAEVIRKGGLVAFPTETVYGLGANALDPEAVARIFEAKGRPQDNPLIVHVSRLESVEPLVKEISPRASTLMQTFWPGPSLWLCFPGRTQCQILLRQICPTQPLGCLIILLPNGLSMLRCAFGGTVSQ